MTRPSKPDTVRGLRMHPVALAAALLLASQHAGALPTGAQVQSGTGTVQNLSATQQLVTQGTNKLVIDWQSFSIAEGERVRFSQPSSSAVVLNRVVGYDPSAILGQMEANGRVFLLNPQGVLFGRNARVDATALVVSTLNLSNADFLAGQYRLNGDDGLTARGTIVNEGTLAAGTVALVGPQVVNRGLIQAPGGRVGLAAADRVLVDVEGDGLVLFQTEASQAGNRLDQLGRIEANGGSVELRAAARGSFADMVLNMEGVVQARSLGLRDGRVVIDGGASGVTRVAGSVDVSGTASGERGGRIAVLGDRLVLEGTAVLDARGDAGGGSLLVGGNWQGQGDERHASTTLVSAGAALDASALAQGDGGKVVLWSDGITQFDGAIRARGGALGGDGGQVETSGTRLLVQGTVDAGAAFGANGLWLLDPTNITIGTAGNADVNSNALGTSLSNGANILVSTGNSTSAGNDNGDILVTGNVTANLAAAQSATLTLSAARNITIDNNNFIAAGLGSLNVNLFAAVGPGDVAGSAATGSVTMSNASSRITANGGDVRIIAKSGVTLEQVIGARLLDVASGGSIAVNQNITTTGNQVWSGAVAIADAIALNAGSGKINLAGGLGATTDNLTLTSSSTDADAVRIGGAITGVAALTVNGRSTLAANVSTTGAQTYTGTATLGAGTVTLNADAAKISLAGVAGGGNNLVLTTTSVAADAVSSGAMSGLGTLNVNAASTLSGSVASSGNQTYAGLVSFGGASLDAGAGKIDLQSGLSSAGAVTLTSSSTSADAIKTGANISAVGLTVNAPLTLSANAVLDAGSGKASFAGAIAGGTHNLEIRSTDTSADAVNLQAAVGGVGSFTITGKSTLAANITSSGAQTYTGAVTLAGDVVFTGVGIGFQSTLQGSHAASVLAGTGSASFALDVGGGGSALTDLTVGANSISFGGSVTGTGTATLYGSAAGTAIDLVSAGTVPAPLLLSQATLDKFAAASGFTSLVIGSGAAGGDITAGDLLLTNATTLHGANIALAKVDSAPLPATTQALAVDAGTAVTFGAAVGSIRALASLDVTGTAKLGAGITSAGTQTFHNGVDLLADVTLAGSSVALLGGANGAQGLTITGDAVLAGSVGNVNALTALSVSGATELRAATIATAGDQSYSGAVTLAQGTSSLLATGHNIAFGSTLDSADATARSLSVTATGDGTTTGIATFTGAIGGTHPLADLTLFADAMVFTAGGTIGGTGTATLATGTLDNAIGLAGAAGALQLPQATLDRFAGFDTLAIGRASGAGTITANALVLPTDTRLQSGSGAITLASVDNGGGTPRDLVVASPLGTVSVGALGSLGVPSTTYLRSVDLTANAIALNGSGVLSLLGQRYAGPVSFGAASVLIGESLDFTGSVATGGFNLTWRTDDLTLGGNVTGGGGLTLAPAAGVGSIGLGTADGTHQLDVAATTLAKLAGVTTLTIGASANAIDAATGLVLPTDTVLRGGSGNVTLAGTVDGTVADAQSLTVDVGSGSVSFGGDVGATTRLSSLAVTGGGSTALKGLIRTAGTQSYAGDVTLTGTTTLEADALAFSPGATLDVGAFDLVLAYDSTFSGLTSATGTGVVSFAPRTASRNIFVGNDDGGGLYEGGVAPTGADFVLTNAGLAAFSGFARLGVGRPDGSGSMLVGVLAPPAGTTSFKLQTGSGDLRITRNLSGIGYDLTAQSASGTIFLGSASSALTVSSGGFDQQYLGQVRLVGNPGGNRNTSLIGGDIRFSGSVDATNVGGSAESLTVNASGVATLGGAVGGSSPLDYLNATGSAGISLGAAVHANNWIQLFSPVRLTADAGLTVTGTTWGVYVYDTLDSAPGQAHSLAIQTGNLARLDRSIGANDALSSLSVTQTGTGTTELLRGGAGEVRTTGAQTFDGAVRLYGNTTIRAANANFLGSVDAGNAGVQSLVVESPGAVVFSGAVGAIAPLASLTSDALGSVSLRDVSVTGAVALNDDATLNGAISGGSFSAAGSTTLAGSSSVATGSGNISFGGAVDAANAGVQSLSLFSTGVVSLASPLGGTKALGSLSSDAGGSISLGDVTASGAITLGDASVTISGATTTFTSTGGNVTVAGSLDGTAPDAQSLVVASPGTTSFQGNVGSNVRLNALATTLGGSTVVRNVSTSGTQAYFDTLTLGANAQLDASAIHADALAAGTFNLTLRTDLFDLSGSASGSGSLDIAPTTVAGTIGVAGGPGTLQLGSALLAKLTSFNVLTIGRNGSGDITFDGITLPTNTVVAGGSGDVNFTSTVDGAKTLDVGTSGTTRFLGLVGATTPLVDLHTHGGGITQIDSVTTSGDQVYDDDVLLGGPVTLRASGLYFNASLDAGALALTTRSDVLAILGSVSASGAVAIAPFAASGSMGLAGAAGTLQLDSTLLAKFSGASQLTLGQGGSGAITAGALTLPTDTLVDAGSGAVTFSGSVDGAHLLAVASSGATVFSAPVGALVPLAGLATDAGGSASLASVTTAGPISLGDATVTLNGNYATGGGNFSIAGNTILGNTVTVDGGSGDVTFSGTVKSQFFSPRSLTVLSSGATTFGGAIGGADPSEGTFIQFLSTDSGGTVSLGSVLSSGGMSIGDVATFSGTIYTAGPVTFGAASTLSGTIQTENGGTITASGPVTIAGAGLNVDTTINGGVAQIVFGSTVDGSTAGAQSLTTTSVLGTSFGGVVGGTVPLKLLTVNGPALLSGSVTTAEVQTYNGSLVLNGDVEFFASDVVFGGTVSGSGSITLAPSSLSADVFIADAGGGAGAFTLSQADLDKFEQLGGLIIGRDGSSGTVTVGNVLLSTNITLRSSGNVNFTGSVDSNPNAMTPAGADKVLVVDTTGLTSFAGAVGALHPLESLSVSGAASIAGGSLTSTVSQSYGGNVSLGADTRFAAPLLAFGGALAAGAHDLQLVTDALSIAGIASGTGLTQISPLSVGSAICIACDPATTGALLVPQSLIDSFAGAALLTIGSSTGSGAITAQAFTLPTDIAILGDTASVSFAGSVASAGGGAHALSVTTTGMTLLQQAVGAGAGALSSLLISGPATLAGGSIATAGAQSYGSAVTLAADTSLQGTSISFAGTVNGAHALSILSATTSFGAAVGNLAALASLSTDAAGTTSLAAPVTASGAISLADRLLLAGDVTLQAGSLALGGGGDGAHALVLQASGGTQLAGSFGGVTPLSSLAIAGPLTLAGDLAFSGGSFSVGGDVDGAHAMSLQNSGLATFGGNVGTGTTLTTLSVSGAVQVSGATTLRAGALALGGPLGGATDLHLLTDELSGATALAGSGVLTIAPLSASRSIGLAGAAGALQVSQATLDGAGSFGEHRIGRGDGSGTLSAGNLQLRSATTLLAGSGGIDLGGTVDGAFALRLNTPGRTRIAGNIGNATALASLSIDDTGAADEFTFVDAASLRIASSGAQQYGDRVQATGDVRFDAASVSALHAGNVFEGVLSGNVGTMNLQADSALTLGSLRLASGGSIEAGGILSLAGNLVLDGGTLSLTSNAVPVAGNLTDPEYADRLLAFRLQLLQENSAVIEQLAGSTVVTAANSLLVLRAPQLGSISLEQTGNVLAGGLSAVSGPLGGDITPRFSAAASLPLGMVRLRASEINVAGAPPANGDQTLLAAGIEADAVRIAADRLSTGQTGQIRARLPFDNTQGSQTSLPSLTLELTPASYSLTTPFGGPTQPQWLQVRLGDAVGGGYMTVRPLGAAPLAPNTFVFLGGEPVPRPFYDGSEKPTEIAVFYNGEVPRTPQEAGALNAVTSVVENARRARFEEAVRTENVASRLRQGVIAEVGAGRPATEGREGARTPPVCPVKPASLQCE